MALAAETSDLVANAGLDLTRCGPLKQPQLDWLLGLSVSVEAMIRPDPMRLACGRKASDGYFEDDPGGERWLVFPERPDAAYWQPKTGDLATWHGRAFALGEEAIQNPATYAFNYNLNIFASPLDWLRADRDGIVIIRWEWAFDRLRECPRIAIAESLLPTYRRYMRPARVPEVSILADRSIAA